MCEVNFEFFKPTRSYARVGFIVWNSRWK